MPISSIPAGGGGGGTVTSVGVANNDGFLDVTNSPVTTAGDIDIDLAATGTADATTFLRGDNTWAVPAGSGSTVSYGAFASLPATCATGDVYIVSDRRWTYVATATNTWEARLNGVPIVPPIAANFTYTLNASTTSAVTDTYAGMKITKGNQNGAAVLRSNTAAPSTFTYEIGYESLQKGGASFTTFGLALMQDNTTSTPLEVAGSVYDNTTAGSSGITGMSYFSPPGTFQSNPTPVVSYAVEAGQVWVRVVKDATNLTYYTSRNGVDWAQYQQHLVAANLTGVLSLGFSMYNENGPSSPTVNNDTYSVFHFKVV